MTFGQRVRMLRESRYLSQSQLADALGVRQTRVSSWETDTHVPGFSMMQKIADYFRVPFSSLLPAESERDNDLVLLLSDVAHSNPVLFNMLSECRFLTDSELEAVLSIVRTFASAKGGVPS